MTDVLTALQEDFKLFLQALWGQLDLPEPTRAQYAIADYLQSGPKRLQIQAFRGVGKSWITGAFVLWTLFKDSEKKIMIISASKERADNMSIFLQNLSLKRPGYHTSNQNLMMLVGAAFHLMLIAVLTKLLVSSLLVLLVSLRVHVLT